MVGDARKGKIVIKIDKKRVTSVKSNECAVAELRTYTINHIVYYIMPSCDLCIGTRAFKDKAKFPSTLPTGTIG
jgi:hypothetical protein